MPQDSRPSHFHLLWVTFIWTADSLAMNPAHLNFYIFFVFERHKSMIDRSLANHRIPCSYLANRWVSWAGLAALLECIFSSLSQTGERESQKWQPDCRGAEQRVSERETGRKKELNNPFSFRERTENQPAHVLFYSFILGILWKIPTLEM